METLTPLTLLTSHILKHQAYQSHHQLCPHVLLCLFPSKALSSNHTLMHTLYLLLWVFFFSPRDPLFSLLIPPSLSLLLHQVVPSSSLQFTSLPYSNHQVRPGSSLFQIYGLSVWPASRRNKIRLWLAW